MSTSFDQVLQAALTLPVPDRALLVDQLIGTLEPEDAAPLDDAWLAEIERRSREFDEGRAQATPWDEVRARAWRRNCPNG